MACSARSLIRPAFWAVGGTVCAATAEGMAAALAATALPGAGFVSQSSEGTSSRACTAGSCQPPFQLAWSSALPRAEALMTAAGMPGRLCSQCSAWAASRPCRLRLPLPVVLRSSPLTLAFKPGAVSDSTPLPPRAAGCASSWPFSSASSVRIRSADSTSVPPSFSAFQLPVALASRRRSCSSATGGLLLVRERGGGRLGLLSEPLAACKLASKVVRGPWPLASALPLSRNGPRRLCSCAGSMPCSTALACHAGAVPVGLAGVDAVDAVDVVLSAVGGWLHWPLASSWPPAS